MAREVECIESKPVRLELGDDQVKLLIALGERLAGTKSWWGSRAESNEDKKASVIHVSWLDAQSCQVVFRDVVGVVRVGDLQLRVVPKIPQAHFNFLAARSEIAPRISDASIAASTGEDLADLLARWFVTAAERLCRQGFRRDYNEHRDELVAIRGRLDAVETALAGAMGRLVAVCDFDELTEDTPLNRLIRTAAHQVSRVKPESGVAERARRLAAAMLDVGRASHLDMRARVDRVSHRYAEVIPLAKLLLDGGALSTSIGRVNGTAFLLRTPEIVEDGLRSILGGLLANHRIEKRRLELGDSGLSLNPDLVFDDGHAIGDVKYRYFDRDWSKAHFNQVVTFATGFGATKAAVIGFALKAGSQLPRSAPVGAVGVRAFGWATDIEPLRAADALSRELGSWLKT